MNKRIVGVLGAAAGLALFAAGPAVAQKSKDTLRMAINDTFNVLDPYYFPQDEAGAIYRNVYETLVSFDERKQVFVPRLAKSWKRVSPKVLEFELRQGVKFHNGNKFDADDVVHTVNYLKDPKVKIRFKGRFRWVESVEKLGPYKVRITAKRPMSTDLSTLAYRFFIYDAETHNSLKDKSAYGRLTPVATGPYKVASLDPQRGIILQRFDAYYDKTGRYRAPIKTVHGRFIADRQTQLAEFFAGNLDLMRNVTADIARELGKMPNARISPLRSGNLLYLTLDAAGRSANKAMTDQRVRKAVMMAIDRKALRNTVIPGGNVATVYNGVCDPVNVGCSTTTKPQEYDPAGAKKLLAAAGHPNGLDLEMKVYAPIKQIGEAVAGQLRKVGIRTSIRPLPLSVYVKLRAKGQFTAFTGFYPTGSHPDVANLMNFFFSGTRDYWKDPIIQGAKKAGSVEFDIKKRTAIYVKALDRVNEMNYILPIGELPNVWAHTPDVEIKQNPLSALESRLGDYFFK